MPAVQSRSNGTIFMIEGAGHYSQVEMPDRFGPQVITILSAGRGGDGA